MCAIALMAVALKAEPVAPAAPSPTGLVWEQGDWLYDEWSGGSSVSHIGADASVARWSPPEVPAPVEPAASAVPPAVP